MKTALDTDERQKKERGRSTPQRVWLYFKRTVAWLIVISVISGFVIGILFLYQLGENGSSNDECPSFDSLSLDNTFSAAKCYIEQYATTIAITMGNLILPFLFSIMSNYEDYDQKNQLLVDLFRNITMRLVGLAVIIYGHISTNG